MNTADQLLDTIEALARELIQVEHRDPMELAAGLAQIAVRIAEARVAELKREVERLTARVEELEDQ